MRPLKTFASLLLIAAVGAGWWLVAPASLGGPVSYVVTSGNSMEPSLHTDDLVIVREAPTYQKGDVAAYRTETVDKVFLHRIVGTEGGRFLFKGDNNDFIDSEHPGPDQILGKKWLVIPQGGKAIEWLAQPMNAALVTGAVVLVLLAGAGGTRRRRRRAGFDIAIPEESAPAGSAGPEAAGRARGHDAAAVVGIAAVVALVLGLAAVGLAGRAEPTTTLDQKPYTVTGHFTYSATAPASAVYPDGRVTTGTPLFLKQVDDVEVSFTERFASPHAIEASGDTVLRATVSDSSGWTRVVASSAPASFEDGDAAAQLRIDLDRVAALVKKVRRLTGVEEVSHTLSVAAMSGVSGTLDGTPFQYEKTSPLRFQMDPLKARLVREDPELPEGSDPLNPVTESEAEAEVQQPAVVRLAGASLEPETVRVSGLGAIAAALLLGLVAGLLWLRRKDSTEWEDINRRHGKLIVDVASIKATSPRSAVEASSFEELVRLSSTYERMILHEHDDGIHTYVVEEDGVAYWYQVLGAPVDNVRPFRRRPEPAVSPDPADGAVRDGQTNETRMQWRL